MPHTTWAHSSWRTAARATWACRRCTAPPGRRSWRPHSEGMRRRRSSPGGPSMAQKTLRRGRRTRSRRRRCGSSRRPWGRLSRAPTRSGAVGRPLRVDRPPSTDWSPPPTASWPRWRGTSRSPRAGGPSGRPRGAGRQSPSARRRRSTCTSSSTGNALDWAPRNGRGAPPTPTRRERGAARRALATARAAPRRATGFSHTWRGESRRPSRS
mmetsp:Transcript_57341/g.178009  ORF Transcript_57341/g.178009 Transcript_57341/m.178009 type:complete len:211 (+) Transcript_57341:713-1345(+)